MAQKTKNVNGDIPKSIGYAPVDGMKMYYEVQGQGKPLILLHGAYMTIEGPMREMANEFSKTRKVILTEFQSHGRTGDIARDITYESNQPIRKSRTAEFKFG